jgi:CrcB protein
VITATLFVVAAAVGALGRAEAGRRLDRDLPWGTLAVNVVGAFALGLLATSSVPVLTVVGVGALGTFTTFSSFARDVVAVVEDGRPSAALAYLAATLVLGVAAAWAGIALTTAPRPPPHRTGEIPAA